MIIKRWASGGEIRFSVCTLDSLIFVLRFVVLFSFAWFVGMWVYIFISIVYRKHQTGKLSSVWFGWIFFFSRVYTLWLYVRVDMCFRVLCACACAKAKIFSLISKSISHLTLFYAILSNAIFLVLSSSSSFASFYLTLPGFYPPFIFVTLIVIMSHRVSFSHFLSLACSISFSLSHIFASAILIFAWLCKSRVSTLNHHKIKTMNVVGISSSWNVCVCVSLCVCVSATLETRRMRT